MNKINLSSNIDKSKLIFSTNKKSEAKIENRINSFQLFWNRYFSKKINYLWLTLFVSFFLLIIILILISAILKYSPDKPTLQSDLAINLPNYFSPIKSTKFSYDDPLLKLIIQQDLKDPNSNIIYNKSLIADIVLLEYNPYALIKSLSGKNYYFFFGTNAYKIDRFSFFVHSFGYSILISIIALIIQWLIGTYLGSVIGFYSQKTSCKIGYYVFNLLNIFPTLIVCLFLFSLAGYNHSSAIFILSVFGSVSFFYIAYANSIELKNQSFIWTYKVDGASNQRILHNIIFVENLWLNLTLFADSLSMNMLILASISFFNVPRINESLNIGNVFKDLINDLTNINYTMFVTIITSLYIIVFKLFSLSLYQASRVKE
ncbi:ABC transporter permease subunit [Mycoplasmopsis primatum]|uniref:ABC transporter permease subunit n=1 Tax=Mycoplasmopsis primatum TaxID=55604 RepID=UPI00049631BC|nr:ABC transporter permease subunit [Mycoplasmopsis primatum]